jgi:hypothetical protein
MDIANYTIIIGAAVFSGITSKDTAGSKETKYLTEKHGIHKSSIL